jgi:YVTN family beta-propeller protein
LRPGQFAHTVSDTRRELSFSRMPLAHWVLCPHAMRTNSSVPQLFMLENLRFSGGAQARFGGPTMNKRLLIILIAALVFAAAAKAQTITATVTVGAGPGAVAVNPVTNKIYVTNSGSNNVTVIDGATNTTTTVPAGTGAGGVSVNTVTNKI